MAQRERYTEIIGDGILKVFPLVVVLTIFSIPLGFLFQCADSFVANHRQWSQDSSFAGYVASFYESYFLESIKSIHRDIKYANSLGKAKYVIITFVAALAYVIVIPTIILGSVAMSKSRKNIQKHKKNMIKAFAVVLAMWAIPLLFMGGLLYMEFYFSPNGGKKSSIENLSTHRFSAYSPQIPKNPKT